VRGGFGITAIRFRDAYGAEWADTLAQSQVPLQWADGRMGAGYWFCEPLELQRDVEIMAHFPDGAVAITCAEYGKGHGVYIGTWMSYMADAKLCDLVSRWVTPDIESPGMRADWLTGEQGAYLVAMSHGNGKEVRMQDKRGGWLRHWLTDERVRLEEGRADIGIANGDCDVWWFEED